MRTIIIPGYSHKNKEWAEETAKNIPDSMVYEWKHWSDPSVRFKAKDEASNIKNLVGENEINIVAKSIGTLVTVISLKDVKTNRVILCGIPVNDINDDDKWNYKILSDISPEKIVVFQNSDDEHGSFEEVRRFLSGINPHIKIVEKPGSTHDYPYYDEFKEILK